MWFGLTVLELIRLGPIKESLGLLQVIAYVKVLSPTRAQQCDSRLDV